MTQSFTLAPFHRLSWDWAVCVLYGLADRQVDKRKWVRTCKNNLAYIWLQAQLQVQRVPTNVTRTATLYCTHILSITLKHSLTFAEKRWKVVKNHWLFDSLDSFFSPDLCFTSCFPEASWHSGHVWPHAHTWGTQIVFALKWLEDSFCPPLLSPCGRTNRCLYEGPWTA